MKFYESKAKAMKGSRAPYGARGLKFSSHQAARPAARRAPYGARGLKWVFKARKLLSLLVAPRMGRVD